MRKQELGPISRCDKQEESPSGSSHGLFGTQSHDQPSPASQTPLAKEGFTPIFVVSYVMTPKIHKRKIDGNDEEKPRFEKGIQSADRSFEESLILN